MKTILKIFTGVVLLILSLFGYFFSERNDRKIPSPLVFLVIVIACYMRDRASLWFLCGVIGNQAHGCSNGWFITERYELLTGLEEYLSRQVTGISDDVVFIRMTGCHIKR
nr:IncF plasmid conjugative transfer protein TrbA [Escherichia coli]